MASGLEDLEALAALTHGQGSPQDAAAADAPRPGRRQGARGKVAAAGGQRRSAGVVAQPQEAVVLVEDDAAQDLVALGRIGEGIRGRPKLFEPRSAALLQHARGAKERKRLQTVVEEERNTRRRIEERLRVLALEVPTLGRCLQGLRIKARAPPPPAMMAFVHMRLAGLPRCKSSSSTNSIKAFVARQTRSTDLVASCAFVEQQRYCDTMLCHGVAGNASTGAPSVVPSSGAPQMSIVALTGQWDETSQRLRPFRKFAFAKASTAQTNLQVFGCTGGVHRWRFAGPTVADRQDHPWKAMSLRLDQQARVANVARTVRPTRHLRSKKCVAEQRLLR